jgi:hypothetical protein
MKRSIVLSLFVIVIIQAKAQFIVNSNGIDLVSTTTLSTNGDWVNTGVFTNNGTLILQDNWTNQGTYLPGTGKIILDYIVNHSFDHNNQPIAKLTKRGAGSLTLFSNALVLDSLLLQHGLVLSSSDTLMLGDGAAVNNSPTSYIIGRVTHLGTGTKYFPIGNINFPFPVKLTQVSGAAPKVTASVETFPAGYTAGAGVDSLITSFPVAWRIAANALTDTASYMDFQFPTSMVSVPSVAIAARAVSGNQFESMGKRSLSDSKGNTNLISYAKGLKGLFTIAAGFGGNFETDSLALVTFYNNTGAAAWTKDSNWLTGNINTWQGITQTGNSITAITLDAANINGSMPSEIADILSLVSVNVANNNIDFIPDFSNLTALSSLNVANNKLDFASLEPNASLGAAINYSNQKPINLNLGDSVLVDAGTDYSLITNIGGSQNNYTYLLNNTAVNTSTEATYVIPSINRNNMGSYQVQITNPLVPGLTLSTLPVSVLAVVDVSGRMLVNATTPATEGIMNLFKVTSTGAYDTTQVISVNEDGSYLFEKVILDKYIVFCKPDEVLYPESIPTYFPNTIFWEEATALEPTNDITGLDIIAQSIRPDVPTGNGLIGGFLEEDVEENRTERTRRIANAGVTARRTEGTGRGKEVVYVLVGYTFTNEDGEFEFTDLPQGQYRLNIQYPGFPMDSTSFIDFTIGTGLNAEVQVAALVSNNAITVRKRIVTGLYEQPQYQASVFPNPTVETIQVSFVKDAYDRELVLLDVNGQQLIKQAAPDDKATVDVTSIRDGVYLLQVKEQGVVKKIVRVVIGE